VKSPGGAEPAYVLYVAYSRMVREAGGLPVILTPTPADRIAGLLDRIDGVVLTGGGDIEPSRYGGTDLPSVYGVDTDRDAFELALAGEAADRRMPLLAICRGMQVLNVARGGTLIEDISTHLPDALAHQVEGEETYRGIHEVSVVAGSTTAKALGSESVRVKSVHHQSVRKLAPDFRITATADDGIVEGYEATDGSWPMWAVQWHPEWLPDDPASRGLFEALIGAAV